jgi:hypothetical protein
LRLPLDNYLDLGADVIAARPAREGVDISVETILVAILGGLCGGLPLSVRQLRAGERQSGATGCGRRNRR